MASGIILKTGESFDVDQSLDAIRELLDDRRNNAPTAPLELHVRDASGPDRRCLVMPDQIAAVFARSPRI